MFGWFKKKKEKLKEEEKKTLAEKTEMDIMFKKHPLGSQFSYRGILFQVSGINKTSLSANYICKQGVLTFITFEKEDMDVIDSSTL